MPELIANPPWYIPSTIALAAVILIFQGNARQHAGMKRIGVVFALIAAVVIAIGTAIESDSEKIVRKTQELAQAVNKRNWKAFSALLSPEIRFLQYSGREGFTTGAQKAAENAGVKDITLSAMEVTREVDSYRVDFKATADLDIASRRVPTNWRLLWSRAKPDSEFELYQITYVASPQTSGESVFSQFR